MLQYDKKKVATNTIEYWLDIYNDGKPLSIYHIPVMPSKYFPEEEKKKLKRN